jgi:hypothetical protein
MLMSRGAVFTAAIVTAMGFAATLFGASPAAAQKQIHPNPPLYMQDFGSFKGKAQELADREEIRDLIAIYAHRVANGESIADLFTDDGVWTIRRLPDQAVEVVSGMKELTEHFKKSAPEAEHPMPMIHNFLIKLDGDKGQGLNSNELRISVEGKSIIASGYYEDLYRRVDGRWRFARRDTTFFHWVPIQQGWARPTEKK